MFYSQCLLSSKGPLGAIWVAAYFFKKLKKTQVTETDISASVDKILQDEVNVVAYRVLAYLLLGVVRIYSKKVEYLFDDCHEALIKINDFVVSTKERTQRTHMRTLSVPYFSITLPEKFELDAFDLEILDDVSGGNVVSREEITLKDGAWENEQMGRYSLDQYHYEEISVFHRTSSMDYTFTDNILSSEPMDIDMGVSTSYNLTCIEAQMENLQEKSFSRAECVDPEMFCEGEEEPMDPYTPFGEYHQTNGETTKVLAIRQSEGKVPGEASRGKHQDNTFSQEGLVNVEMFSTTNREPLDHVNLSGQDHQIDGGQRKFLELAQENQMHHVIQEVSGMSNLETSLEKLRGDKFSQVECMDPGLLCGAKEEPSKLARRFEEEPHDYTETIKLPSLTSSENRKCQVNTEEHTLSITLDGTPQSKFPDASGASMPELICTPSVRERARVSRKRKCLIDETIVLANEVLRRSIHDASDLVSKRRKCPHNALAAWKASQISSLPQGFLEPSIPGISLELKSLFHANKLKILESAETRNKSEKLDIPESPTVGRSDKVAECPTVGRSEQIAIAPKTPVKSSTLTKSFQSDGNAKNLSSEGLRPASSFGSEEEEPSPSKDHELDLILMNEEIYSCAVDNLELYGWSGRTRIAARYLYKNFQNRKKGREKEVVSLLRVLEGRNKKESARLFYEILVLRSTGYVRVKQDNAYGDIQVRKLPKWDESCV